MADEWIDQYQKSVEELENYFAQFYPDEYRVNIVTDSYIGPDGYYIAEVAITVKGTLSALWIFPRVSITARGKSAKGAIANLGVVINRCLRDGHYLDYRESKSPMTLG